jgi:NAD(P)-dependent dehydrogenase (short-subunit alcohol dehydrogenase family)
MEHLEGKVAVVTGSGSGIGQGIAERFAREGMRVVVADNRLDAAESVAAGIVTLGRTAIAMPVDVTKRESVDALADRVDAELGGADVLVNNAGVGAPSSYLEADDAGWNWVLDVNLYGVLYGIQAFVPRMLASGREGHVVNTASFGGVIGPLCLEGNRTRGGDGAPTDAGTMKSYMVSKHAVVAMSEGLAGDLDGTPIGVSVLCPAHHEPSGIYENSAKYRPAEYGGPDPRIADLAADARRRHSEGDRSTSELAGRVVRAIRERHFWIFTHPENRWIVERRIEHMLAGFDDAASYADE